MNLADNCLVVFEPSMSISTISRQSELNLKLAVLVQSLEQSLLKILALLRLSFHIKYFNQVFNNKFKYSLKNDVMAKLMTFQFF